LLQALFGGFLYGFRILITSGVVVNGVKKIVHGAGGVMTQMVQVYMDYSSLPSIRDITLDEVRFFVTVHQGYEGGAGYAFVGEDASIIVKVYALGIKNYLPSAA
jgi:hypothetical protein